MPGRAIGIELNLGYAGTVSRSIDTIITPRVVKSTIEDAKEKELPIMFGEPVVLNKDNTYSRFGEKNKADEFIGIAVREVKQASNYYSSTGAYFPNETCDVINRGSITVVCNNGTPTAGGKVYIRIKENSSKPNGIVAGFEAMEDGDNTIEIPNLKWTTGKIDSNKISEVTILTRTM